MPPLMMDTLSSWTAFWLGMPRVCGCRCFYNLPSWVLLKWIIIDFFTAYKRCLLGF